MRTSHPNHPEWVVEYSTDPENDDSTDIDIHYRPVYGPFDDGCESGMALWYAKSGVADGSMRTVITPNFVTDTGYSPVCRIVAMYEGVDDPRELTVRQLLDRTHEMGKAPADYGAALGKAIALVDRMNQWEAERRRDDHDQ